MSEIDINSLDWQKMNGLLPAIIQNVENGQVIMLGYMNQEALIATLTSGQLTMYSRTRQRLWRKGDNSGNSMALEHIRADRDNDSLLIQVRPKESISRYQPVCTSTLGTLDDLITLINERAELESENSYTSQLLSSGVARCAQKVGEEAVETVIAAVNGNQEELMNESADLLFHFFVLLKACELSFYDVLQCMQERDPNIYT